MYKVEFGAARSSPSAAGGGGTVALVDQKQTTGVTIDTARAGGSDESSWKRWMRPSQPSHAVAVRGGRPVPRVLRVLSSGYAGTVSKLLLVLLALADAILGSIAFWIGASALWNARGVPPLYLISSLALVVGVLLLLQAGLTIFLFVKGDGRLLYFAVPVVCVLVVLAFLTLILVLVSSEEKLSVKLTEELSACTAVYFSDRDCADKMSRIQRKFDCCGASGGGDYLKGAYKSLFEQAFSALLSSKESLSGLQDKLPPTCTSADRSPVKQMIDHWKQGCGAAMAKWFEGKLETMRTVLIVGIILLIVRALCIAHLIRFSS